MAATSLAAMIFMLLFAFFWGYLQDQQASLCSQAGAELCMDFSYIGKNCVGGVVRDAGASIAQGTAAVASSSLKITSKIAITDPNQLVKTSPKVALNLMQSALDAYYEEYGNLDVPEGWVVPAKTPWRKDIWGLRLGTMLWSLGGSGAGSSSSISSVDKKPPITTSPSTIAPRYGGNSLQADLEEEEEGSNHRGETWYELFYDLVFVASALQLGLIIKYDHRPLGIAKAAILFYMLRSTWDHLTTYQNRFHHSDLTHMAYYVLQSMGAFVIALHLRIEESIHYENEASWDREMHQRPIALMAGGVRLLTVFMYLKEGARSPRSRPYVFRVLLHTGLSAAVYFSSIFCSVTDDARMYLWIWLLGILVERPLMLVFAFIQKDSPVMVLNEHMGHLVHRHGTFFMLILGEAVIQLVQAYGGFDVFSYVRAILGFAVVFNVGNVYYEQQQREPEKHVLRRSRAMGYLWIELQSLLSLCVLLFAVGLKLVFHGFDEAPSFRDEALMCFFASASLFLMYFMAMLHRGISYNLDWASGRMLSVVFRFMVAGLCIAIPFSSTSSTVTVILLHVLTTTLVFHDVCLRVSRVSVLKEWLGLTVHDSNKAWDAVMDSSISFDASYTDTSDISRSEKYSRARTWFESEKGHSQSRGGGGGGGSAHTAHSSSDASSDRSSSMSATSHRPA
eukprot:gene3112-6115_t